MVKLRTNGFPTVPDVTGMTATPCPVPYIPSTSAVTMVALVEGRTEGYIGGSCLVAAGACDGPRHVCARSMAHSSAYCGVAWRGGALRGTGEAASGNPVALVGAPHFALRAYSGMFQCFFLRMWVRAASWVLGVVLFLFVCLFAMHSTWHTKQEPGGRSGDGTTEG